MLRRAAFPGCPRGPGYAQNMPRAPRPNAQPPPAVLAHSTTTPALQAAVRLARAAPLVATVSAPPGRAEDVAARLLRRYPLAQADHRHRSAARLLGLPAVRLLVMPPRPDAVTLLLFATAQPDERENWHAPTDPRDPLTWHVYELATAAQVQADMQRLRSSRPPDHYRPEALTWRLSSAARRHYQTRITRTVMAATVKPAQKGKKGSNRPNQTRSVNGARRELETLGQHLANLPGLSGVRSDVWAAQRHMLRLWNQHHPDSPPPAWPRHPWPRYQAAELRPLAELLAAHQHQEDQP